MQVRSSPYFHSSASRAPLRSPVSNSYHGRGVRPSAPHTNDGSGETKSDTLAFLRRAAYIMSISAYTAAVVWIYTSLIVPYYGYYGLGNTAPDWVIVYTLAGLAVFPSLWLPTSLARPSDLIIGITYLLIYIPTLLVFPFTSNPLVDNEQCLELGILLLIGLWVMHIARFTPSPFVSRSTGSGRNRYAHVVVYVIFGVCLLVFAVSRGSSGSIAISYEEIYSARADFIAARNSSLSAVIASYAAGWLYGSLVPIIFSYLYFSKRRSLAFGLSFCVCLLIYATTSFRAVMLEPIMLCGVALVVSKFRKSFQAALVIALLAILLPGCYLGTKSERLSESEIAYIGLVPFRMLAVPALALTQYHDFFASNPKTYLSHVRGFSSIITYPYSKPLPAIIGTQYYDLTMEGANAGVWATDGIAAFGSIGVPLSSALLGLLLMLYDSLAKQEDIRISTVALTYIGVSVSSVSMFTTLLTQGWLVFYVLMLLVPAGVLSVFKTASRLEYPSGSAEAVKR
jgi:hypothetical protein